MSCEIPAISALRLCSCRFDMLLVTDEGEILVTEGIADRFTLNEGRTETVRVLEA